jgi:glutaredoxin
MWWLVLIGFILLVCLLRSKQSMQRTQIVRFHKPGCKYCDYTKEEWNAFKNMAATSAVDFDVVDINANDRRDLIIKYQISSVPTVLKITPLGYKEYNGPRVRDAYMQFALTG